MTFRIVTTTKIKYLQKLEGFVSRASGKAFLLMSQFMMTGIP